jgi:hypothetical protein
MSVLSDDIYRFTPLQLGAADFALAHGIDERISVENLGRRLAFYQQVLVGGSAATLPSLPLAGRLVAQRLELAASLPLRPLSRVRE